VFQKEAKGKSQSEKNQRGGEKRKGLGKVCEERGDFASVRLRSGTNPERLGGRVVRKKEKTAFEQVSRANTKFFHRGGRRDLAKRGKLPK